MKKIIFIIILLFVCSGCELLPAKIDIQDIDEMEEVFLPTDKIEIHYYSNLFNRWSIGVERKTHCGIVEVEKRNRDFKKCLDDIKKALDCLE